MTSPLFIGTSNAIRDVQANLEALSQVPWPVRIEGPTGSGKGLAARYLHAKSPRCHSPFVTCGINALSDELAVAQLAGYAKGAFTGAHQSQAGLFEAAHGGTLFLDELGTATPRVQQLLLQLVDEGQVRRIGEQRARRVDVRLVFATNADLEAEIAAGRFREDLYHRLGCLTITMPALHTHVEDIPQLFRHLLERKARESNRSPRDPDAHEWQALMSHAWPGNVRELEKAAEYLVVFDRLPKLKGNNRPLDANWRTKITEALAHAGGNKTAAAKALGISRKSLYQELARKNISCRAS
jgi:two-component system NtrC family response regulator